MFLHHIQSCRVIGLVVIFLIFLVVPNNSSAMLGEDIEKPRPEFTRDGDTITARLVPRAKNTSVQFEFRVTAEGELKDVEGIDFLTALTPDVDVKEFKSAMFGVLADSNRPGAAAEISITSSFFNISTEYWIYNARNTPKWSNSGIKPEKISDDGTYRFTLRVVDGGPMDSDGEANGSIHLIGGPMDPFWSYALGTLLIRFFGIFLVLGVLMVGMLAAGKIFVAIERKADQHAAPVHPLKVKPDTSRQSVSIPKTPAKPETQPEVVAAITTALHLSGLGGSGPDPDTAAAIATALHLHLAPKQSIDSPDSKKNMPGSWVQYGREAIQNVRFQAFQRPVTGGGTK